MSLTEKHINSEEVDYIIKCIFRWKEQGLTVRQTAFEIRKLIDSEKTELHHKNERLGQALKELQAVKSQGVL